MGNALCCQKDEDPKDLSSSTSLPNNEVPSHNNNTHRNGQPSSLSEKKNNNTSSTQVSSSSSSSPYQHNQPSSSSSLHPHLHPNPHSHSYSNSNDNSQQLTSQHHLLHPISSSSSSHSKKNKKNRRPTNGSLSPSSTHQSSSTKNKRLSNSNHSNNSSSTGGHIQFTAGPGTTASASDHLNRTQNPQSLERAMERNNISPDFQWLDGRRYHNNPDASYLLPNDIDEVDRLQLQHFILRYAIQGNYKSPLDKSKVRNILDVGCGPGTWTMEIANEFPDATVTGIDLSAVFPSAIIPGNCRFLQHNILEPFPFPDNHFDFVYQRLLISGLTPEGWVKVVKELERVTKPGGWIELVEVDSHGCNNGPYTTKIWDWITTALETRGIITGFIRDPGLESVMVKAGVENVNMVALKLPTGKFGGKIGQLLKENLFAFWNAIAPMVIHGAGADKVEFEEALRKADREVEEYKYHHIFYVITGQKREDSAVAL